MSSVESTLAQLKRSATQKTLKGMARYAIPSDRAFGVSMTDLKRIAKGIGRDHALAAALWKTGWYEARMLATLIDDPAKVTVAQMNAWSRDFDSWAICDTACFALFDRTPHAWGRIAAWSGKREEFVKRGAFALLASVALHDKKCADAPFVDSLRLIERAADDERNFVKKGVSWALRSIGHRNRVLHEASVALAHELAGSEDSTRRWVGKDVLRDLSRPLVLKRVSKR